MGRGHPAENDESADADDGEPGEEPSGTDA